MGEDGGEGDDEQLENIDTSVLTLISREQMKLGLQGCRQWWRMDLDTRHLKTTAKGGPAWKQVLGRTVIDMDERGVAESRMGGGIQRRDEHQVLYNIKDEDGSQADIRVGANLLTVLF